MKKVLLICAGLTIMLNAKAQFPGMGGGAQKASVTGRITVIVLDSLNKQPVDYATVSLTKVKDGKAVNGGVTDAKGKIVLQNVPTDEYKLSIGFIGYKTKTVLVKTTPEKPDTYVGSISISPTSNTLNEVNIEGKKALIENKIDKVVYNAEQDITNAGGDASDVMRKVPMLAVDINGNPTLRGSAVRVLINGKPSGTMANNVADALKMIPAEQIKSVEVITSPSAKYDAEGAGGIINIITKKKNAQGVNGSVNVAAGTRQNNGNFSLNAKKGRLALTSNVGLIYAIPQDTRVVLLNQNFANNSTFFQDGVTKADRWGYNGSAGLDYDFNNYNNISTNVKFNSFIFNVDGNLPSLATVGSNQFSSTRITDNATKTNNVDWSADYRKTTKKDGEEFSVSGQATFGRNINNFLTLINSSAGNAAPIIGDNNAKNNEYTVQTDYTYPFSKKTILETGLKGVFRDVLSKYQNTNQDFDYNQNVAAAYGVLGFNLTKKITAKVGVRAEYTKIDALSGNSLNFNNDYFNVFPSAIISQQLKGGAAVKLSYNKRIQRPSLFYINPFRNDADPNNITQGNPTLAPEISNNFELGYSTYIKGSVINASVFYRQTSGIIESFYSPGLTTYINAGKNESYGFNLFGSYNPLPKWTLMANFGLNTYEVNNSLTNVSTGTFVNYNGFARSAFAFKGGWNTEVVFALNSAKRTFQGSTAAMKFFIASVKKDIMNKKGSIGLNVLNPFARDLHIETKNNGAGYSQTADIYYPIRSVGINFSYNFGKINYNAKPKTKKVNNDDLKQEEQQGGQMGGAGGKGK